jgi:hypothetical protein
MTDQDYARLQSLFKRAMLLTGRERADQLDRESTGNQSLRRELESLLAYHTQRTILTQAAPVQDEREQALRLFPKPRVEARRPRWSRQSFLRKHGMTLLGIVALLAASLWINHGTQTALKGLLHDKLQTVLATDVAALRLWLDEQRQDARFWAENSQVRSLVAELLAVVRAPDSSPREALASSEAMPQLRELLVELSRSDENLCFAVVDRSGLILAAPHDDNLGARLNAAGMAWQSKVFENGGQVVVTNPYRIGTLSNAAAPLEWENAIWIAAPVRDEHGELIASIGFGTPAAGEFSAILATARVGRTGETYAFDQEGRMLSRSRFEPQLRAIGLLPDDGQTSSALRIQLRDPGGDLTRGYRPRELLEVRPLTRMAASATAGVDGVDLEGYRDYRGVQVVGAWQWLDDVEFGVATEIDAAEAYAALAYPRWMIRGALALLTIAGVGLAWFRYRAVALSQRVRELEQLGQYRLEEELGRGGMGVVYRAQHQWLRRPAAVKVLQTVSPSAIDERRFEREARLASALSHPNTIAIYDFGQTDSGQLYCAMEFLPGLDLSRVLQQQGPCLCPARVVHILKQICGSLAEAHHAGLVHRDLKPSNVMLCERGGLFDFVKVLDFGLATFADRQDVSRVTETGMLTGTLQYLAPERIRQPDLIDPRTDVYGVGTIAFELLTGQPPILGGTPEQLLQAILFQPAPRTQERAPFAIPDVLDELIDACLTKELDRRPSTIADVAARLESIPVPEWTEEDARLAWGITAMDAAR